MSQESGCHVKNIQGEVRAAACHWKVKDPSGVGGGLGVTMKKESFGGGAAGILQRILKGNSGSVAKMKRMKRHMSRFRKQFFLPRFPQNVRGPVTPMSMGYHHIYGLGNDLTQVNPPSGIQWGMRYLSVDHLLRRSAKQYRGLTHISAGYLRGQRGWRVKDMDRVDPGL